ncbi:hypothetical protein [Corynebacterium mustelae]|nr:hypothetical protein [Corynebacterium mustelae]
MGMSRLAVAMVSAVAVGAGTVVSVAAQETPWITMEMTDYTKEERCVFGPGQIHDSAIDALAEKHKDRAASGLAAALDELGIDQSKFDHWFETGDGGAELEKQISKGRYSQPPKRELESLKKFKKLAVGDREAYKEFLLRILPSEMKIEGFDAAPFNMRVERRTLKTQARAADSIFWYVNQNASPPVGKNLNRSMSDVYLDGVEPVIAIIDPCAEKISGSSVAGTISSDFSSNAREITDKISSEDPTEGENQGSSLQRFFTVIFGKYNVILLFIATLLKTLDNLGERMGGNVSKGSSGSSDK